MLYSQLTVWSKAEQKIYSKKKQQQQHAEVKEEEESHL